MRNREPDDRRPARCGHDLTDVPTLTLPAGHFALRAQSLILDAITSGVARFGVYARSPQPVAVALADVRTVASRLLATANPGKLSSVLPADLIEEHLAVPRGRRMALKRPGFMAPPTAASTAVAITAALKALIEPDIQQAGSIMRDLLQAMEREDRAAIASDIYHWGKDSSPFLHAVHLAALGPSMRPSHQLRHRTISDFPARPASGSQLTARRLHKVPTMFWPAWTLRLTPASGVSHTALQPTLSSALLIIGSKSERDDAAGQLGSATDKATISRILQVLQDDHCWPDIHRALDRLAGYLDDHNTPIDYERRRNLNYRHLLPHEQWLDIRQRLKITTGGERQWRITRCVLFQRISGLPVEADAPIAPGDTHFRVELGSFPARQTPELAYELDNAARMFLARQGIDNEPVSWEPPLDLLHGLTLPGPDPAEINIGSLHRLIRAGRPSLEPVAARLGTTYDTVRHVLQEHPAPRTRIAAPSKHAARQALSATEFTRLYQHERLSIHQISELTGFSRGTLTALATEYGITLRPAGSQPRHQIVDRDWLHEQYVVQRRTLPDLARERGVSKATMRTWARLHQIPMRPPGGASHDTALRTTHLAESAPAILRPALTSAYACERLLRFAQAIEHPTLRSAASLLGCSEETLSRQIRRLESDLGGPLLEPFEPEHSVNLTGLGNEVMSALRRLRPGELLDLAEQRPGGRSALPPSELPRLTGPNWQP
ncbi:TniQ family protein [Streptomyces vastus]|uniref:TniQ family protein n=1 Tax=Streptomyces vastus TaxID=285451 RepID=A0ABN3RIX2_9ACTN